MTDYKHILVIQTAFLGDAILTTPLIRAIKETYPDALLDILLIPQSKPIYKHNPHIDKILLFNKKKAFNRIVSFIKLLIKIKKLNYDLAISAQLSMSSSLLMYLAGIPNRLGFPRQKLLTMTIDLPKGIPVVKRYLKLMEALTDKQFSYQTELFWDKEAEDELEISMGSYIDDDLKVVGIAPGSVWTTKRWLPTYFAELIKMLSNHQIKSVLIGGKDDVELCKTIANLSESNPLNLAGKLSLLGSSALIKRLSLIISNDSAPLHIANAVQTDVIAIFGPTVKRFGFYPFRENDRVIEIDLPCRPCGKHGTKSCHLKHFNCMKSVTPILVFNNVIELLEHK
jgi:heptosyltransferase-2